MGLAERRIIKDFQDNHFPALHKQVTTAAGFEVPLEVNWDSLTSNEYSHAWIATWPQLYFEPLIAALKHITQDDMGKQALKDGLKKIVIQDVSGDYYGDTWSRFEAGVVTLDHSFTNAHQVEDRTHGLIKNLEAGL
jgi:hypothetical protein